MKRIFDIAVASVALIVLAFPMLVLAALVRINLGTPIIFSQERIGMGCNRFKMIKFRTMTDGCDDEGNLLSDDVRLTKFGRFLRATSLDELPELWNVLKGDMSIVGPRPLLVQYLERYTKEQNRRHEVRPGVTGWAQVNGRNALSWEEKFRLDVWYVDNNNLWLDLNILLKTVVAVAARKGISAKNEATMPEFKGSNDAG